MAAQSARAHTFDRRMRWFWLRRNLRDTDPAQEDVVDVRGHRATPTGEPTVVPVASGAVIASIPRQRG